MQKRNKKQLFKGQDLIKPRSLGTKNLLGKVRIILQKTASKSVKFEVKFGRSIQHVRGGWAASNFEANLFQRPQMSGHDDLGSNLEFIVIVFITRSSCYSRALQGRRLLVPRLSGQEDSTLNSAIIVRRPSLLLPSHQVTSDVVSMFK